jgi:hypothetical protein
MMAIYGTSRSASLSSGFNATGAYSFRSITKNLSPCTALFHSLLELITLECFLSQGSFASFPPLACTPYFSDQL